MSRVVHTNIWSAYGYARKAGYEGTEEEFEQGLKKSAEAAGNAEESAYTASEAATEADAARDAAAQSAESASTSEGNALEYANSAAQVLRDAQAVAQTVNAKATEAAGSASRAENYAQTATTKASEAATAAETATTAATSASGSAQAADASATAAAASETNAAASASSASTSAGSASESADDAAESAAAAQAVKDSIPSDYTALSDEVTDLKSQLDIVIAKSDYFIRNGTFPNGLNQYNVTAGIYSVNPSVQKEIALEISRPLSAEGNYWSLGYYFVSNKFSGRPDPEGADIISSHGVDTEGSVRNGDYIIVPSNAVGVIFDVSERNSDGTPVTHRSADYVDYKFELLYHLQATYNNAVIGKKISLTDQTYNKKSIISIANAIDTHPLQDIDIYNNVLFAGYDSGILKTYNLSTGALINTINLTPSEPTNHTATLNFGNDFFSDNSEYPALYISGDLTNYCAYVESVTPNTATLKQKIIFDLTEYKKASGSMCLIDNTGYNIYYIQREESNIASNSNKLYCCTFRLPALNDGVLSNDVKIVTLTDNDVINSFYFDDYRTMYQSGCIYNGRIFLIHGISDNNDGIRCGICVYDLNGNTQSKINLNNNVLVEPGGITIYNRKIYLDNLAGSLNLDEIVLS